jgi:hypothetical protein
MQFSLGATPHFIFSAKTSLSDAWIFTAKKVKKKF